MRYAIMNYVDEFGRGANASYYSMLVQIAPRLTSEESKELAYSLRFGTRKFCSISEEECHKLGLLNRKSLFTLIRVP